jgi:hypothetical protein
MINTFAKYGLPSIFFVMIAALGLVIAPSASAEIAEGYWQVSTVKQKNGDQKQYIVKSNTKFTITGEEKKVKIKVECTGFKIQNAGKIEGGNPGTMNINNYELTGCSVKEPEPAECEVTGGVISLHAQSEIVENAGVAGQPLLVFTETVGNNALGVIRIGSAAGKMCKNASCPNMVGSLLTKVSNENSENKEMTLTFSSLTLNKYIKTTKEKPVASLQVGELSPAEFTGSVNIELTTKNPFGVYIK